MNTITRYLTIAVVWGVALIGLTGETRAQTSCTLDRSQWESFKPYICGVSTPAGGSIEKVTWRVTFSEPVTGVSWYNFQTDNTNNAVPSTVPGPAGRKYGLGSVGEEIKKVSNTEYDISMEWECTTAANDCHHNETVTTTGSGCGTGGECTTSYSSSGRTDPYVGEVWLELQSDAEFKEMHAPPLLGNQTERSHVGMPTARVSIN